MTDNLQQDCGQCLGQSEEQSGRINLLELSYEELQDFVMQEFSASRFRADQLWQWIWQKLVTDFDQMTDLSKSLRESLKAKAYIKLPKITADLQSKDGTRKLLLTFADGASVETVLIPSSGKQEGKRVTQCLSSQVGCAMGCTFCHTAAMGLVRNMTAGEILSQVLIARQLLNDTRRDHPIIKNLVFMGMGEPLLNKDALYKALHSLHNPKGFDFSTRRITVSTCGIKQGLYELGASNLAYLALSLHAPSQDLRKKIMPKAASWELEDLLQSLEKYPLKTREYVTFEYLLLGGVNDSPAHAKELVRIMSRMKSKLNLIVYNHSENLPYKAPDEKAILAFQKILWNKGITAIIRKSKGADISAACGQLCVEKL